MNPQDYRVKNRRYSDSSEDGSAMDILRNLGMPFLYITAVACMIFGMICMGIITHYWASGGQNCFLYADTASGDVVYKFGSSLSTCYWITYGPVPAALITIACGVTYWIKVKGKDGVRMVSFVFLGIVIAFALILAVTCTLTEGMRITCAKIGLNFFNQKADNCHSQLDLRVEQLNLPVETSTMVKAASGGYWSASAAVFLIGLFHLMSLYRRSREEDYD